MKAVKNVFILIGLFLLSQVGMTAFSVVKSIIWKQENRRFLR